MFTIIIHVYVSLLNYYSNNNNDNNNNNIDTQHTKSNFKYAINNIFSVTSRIIYHNSIASLLLKFEFHYF